MHSTAPTPSSATLTTPSCAGDASCPLTEPCFEHSIGSTRQIVGEIVAQIAPKDSCPCKTAHELAHIEAALRAERQKRDLAERRVTARLLASSRQIEAEWHAAHASDHPLPTSAAGVFLDEDGNPV